MAVDTANLVWQQLNGEMAALVGINTLMAGPGVGVAVPVHVHAAHG